MTREEVFVIVKMQLIKWNPYGFSTTLSDEFDRESMAVAKLIHIDDSAEQIAYIISKVFSSSFEQESFSLQIVYPVACKISKELSLYNRERE